MSSRPQTFQEFIGNEQAVKILKLHAKYCMKENEPSPHIGLFGPPGNGKTTLSEIYANEIKAGHHYINATSLNSVDDVRSFVMGSVEGGSKRDIIAIDECHQLRRKMQDTLLSLTEHPAKFVYVEDGKRREQKLPRLTSFMFMTTNPGKMDAAFLSRLETIYIKEYGLVELSLIAEQSLYEKHGVNISQEGVVEVGSRARSARDVIKHSNVINEYYSVSGKDFLDIDDVKFVYDEYINVDEFGLSEKERMVLSYLFDVNSASLGTLSDVTNIAPSELQDYVEPYLIKIGFISRGSKGRTLTQKGYEFCKANLTEQKETSEIES